MALVNCVVGSLCAPQKVHNALVMVDVVCVALTTEPSKLSKGVWSPLAVGHFTGPLPIQLEMASVHLCDQGPARQLAWSDGKGKVDAWATWGLYSDLRTLLNHRHAAAGSLHRAAYRFHGPATWPW